MNESKKPRLSTIVGAGAIVTKAFVAGNYIITDDPSKINKKIT
jgi:hypothetical protein